MDEMDMDVQKMLLEELSKKPGEEVVPDQPSSFK